MCPWRSYPSKQSALFRLISAMVWRSNLLNSADSSICTRPKCSVTQRCFATLGSWEYDGNASFKVGLTSKARRWFGCGTNGDKHIIVDEFYVSVMLHEWPTKQCQHYSVIRVSVCASSPRRRTHRNSYECWVWGKLRTEAGRHQTCNCPSRQLRLVPLCSQSSFCPTTSNVVN